MAGFRPILALVIAVVLVFGVVATLGLGASPSDWYRQIKKPSFTPPGWVFGPAWMLLYLSMAVAVWWVWLKSGFTGAPLAMAVFAMQLLLNGLWSKFFFGMHNPGLALADIALLWAAIVGTVICFWRVSPAAGAILLPYLAWVSFASVLNYSIWVLNR